MSYRSELRELAFDTHGVVTVQGAADVGVPAVEVRKLAQRGALERLGHGVYRMTETARGDLDEFAEAVALVGPSAVLVDESVLAAHHLAQINLRSVKVASPARVRKSLPTTIEVIARDVADQERDDIEGIPSVSVGSAILGCVGRVLPDRLVDAARQAVALGLLSPSERDRIIAALGSAP